MQAEDIIYKQLRKAFRNAHQQVTLLQDTMQECHLLVESLANLAEQLQCCRRAADDREGVLVLMTFPDLQAKLENKLIDSMEGILHKLQEHVNTLQGARSKLYYQYTHSLSAYQRHSQELGFDRAIHRTSTWPSIADMLQWLADIDKHYGCICAERQWMLNTIAYDNLDNIQTLPKKWKLAHSNKNTFQDILAHVSFFMAGS